MELGSDYRWITAHLVSRRFRLDIHRAWLSHDLATFPIYNLSGQIIGCQQYRPFASKEPNNNPKLGRYFTRLPERRVGVWGLESWSVSRTLFVCEGVFDAAAVTDAGFSAIAVFANDLSDSVACWLSVVRKMRPVVALLDSDEAGRNLAKHAHRHYQSKTYKDPGEYPREYILELCKQFNES